MTRTDVMAGASCVMEGEVAHLFFVMSVKRVCFGSFEQVNKLLSREEMCMRSNSLFFLVRIENSGHISLKVCILCLEMLT